MAALTLARPAVTVEIEGDRGSRTAVILCERCRRDLPHAAEALPKPVIAAARSENRRLKGQDRTRLRGNGAIGNHKKEGGVTRGGVALLPDVCNGKTNAAACRLAGITTAAEHTAELRALDSKRPDEPPRAGASRTSSQASLGRQTAVHALSATSSAPRARGSRLYKALLATLLAATVTGVPRQLAAQTDGDTDTRPNIVVFLADDMGWGQPGFNGGREVATPNMNRIANEGVKLTRFYVQPVCSPTRASLLTGRYPWKNGMDLRPTGEASNGMLLDEHTIAQTLGDAGYATWMVGKWHLGHWRREHLPLQRGFDHHYGHYGSEIDSFTHLRIGVQDWHRNGRPVVESGYATFLMADEAVQLIERHDGTRPFFLYLPFNAPHVPHQAPEEYLEKYRHLDHGEQRAQLEAMDVAMGRVMDALDIKGVLDDTLVMFLNDNGGTRKAGENRPYRGTKGQYHEGGILVPAVLRWPGEIPSGSESDALLHVVDLFPTFAGLAGAETGAGLPLDGLDAWDAIANGAESPRNEVVHSLDVIRVGAWKLIEEDARYYNWSAGALQLYNIRADPYEATNLAAEETAKVSELRARLAYHRQFSRDGEAFKRIPGHPPVIFGREENAAYRTEVRTALRQRAAGNPAPALLRLEVSGDSVKLVYDESLDADSVPPASAFRVVVNPGHKAAEVTGVEVSGSEVVLALAQAVGTGETAGLTYEVPSAGAIRDAAGVAAVGVTWVQVDERGALGQGPLTAWFQDVPSAHDGTSPFKLRLRFSESVSTNDFTLRDTAIRVTAGRITQVRRVVGLSWLWELTVVPSGMAAVVLALPATASCSDTGAVCTAGGKELASSLEVTVRKKVPVVSIAAATNPVREGVSAVFEVTLDETAPEALTVGVSVTESGSMLPGARPSSVSFSMGATSATLSVATEGDSVVEEDSTVTATVAAGPGYWVGTRSSASATVEDDDGVAFTVSVAPAVINEGESGTLRVVISNGVTFAEDQVVALAVSGTASASDYAGLPAALTLVAGASAVTAELVASDDQEEEADETLTVEASRRGVRIGTATVTIASVSHDAALDALSLSGIDIGAFSGPVTSYAASVGHELEVTEVTATASDPAARVSIAPGAEVSLAEGANEITVTVTAEDGTTTRVYTVTVTRAGLPEVTIAAAASPVPEGAAAQFEVTLDKAAAETLTVGVSVTESGSMLSGTRPSSVSFPMGATSTTLSAATERDSVVEADSTVTASVVAGTGYRAGTPSSASVTVEDDDAPAFTVSAAPAAINEGESATLTVAVSNGVTFAEDQAVALAVSGTASAFDYAGLPAALTLVAGASSVTAELAASDDQEEEADETLRVEALHGGFSVGTASLMIADTEFVPLIAQFVDMPVTHDGQAAFTFELRFSEEVDIGSGTLRDAAFKVTGGTVSRARRLVAGSNRRWELRVRPASDADVVPVLAVTADCGAIGAVCAASGKPLSNRLQATVEGPGSESTAGGFSLAPENSSPSGIWSDGETVWVADLADARLYAYQLEDGGRQPEKDIATEPSPMGLWSDGQTLWVAQLGGGLRAHRLADGARLAGRDLALEGNAAPAGVWSDGETAWVSEWLGDTVHAYRLEDGRRVAGRDIKLAGGNLLPMGLWSDGETMWVADWRERMYAYRLADRERMPERDVSAGSMDEDPSGLWSGDGTLLSTSWESGDVRAYPMPEAGPRSMDAGQLKGHGGHAGSTAPIADPALLAAIKAALGKASGDSVSAAELAGLETLAARNRGITDLAGLEGATSLKELDLGFNPAADLRLLALLPALESLNLDGRAPDLQLLASLAGLKRLSLRNNGIDDLRPLAPLAGLTELDVGGNRIADLYPLTGLTRLTVLRADRNRIADLWPLASLAGLEALELGANRVRDLQPLAGLTQITSLRLEGNGLTELHPLAGLNGLRDLGLAGNAVESVRALADLDGLRRLDLRGNAVEDLRPLRALSSLVWVHVGGSHIKDLTPLDNRSGLTVAGREDRDSPSAVNDSGLANRWLGRAPK